jgi:hypothetical protein
MGLRDGDAYLVRIQKVDMKSKSGQRAIEKLDDMLRNAAEYPGFDSGAGLTVPECPIFRAANLVFTVASNVDLAFEVLRKGNRLTIVRCIVAGH